MASWWITFHGSTGGVSNVQTYTTSGVAESTALLMTGAAGEPALDELRGFLFASAGVLVANASGNDSSVVAFTPPSPGQWGFSSGAFITDKLTHPFDLTPAFNGDIYVSNQSHKGKGGNDITYYHPKTGDYKGTFAQGFTELRGLAYDGTYLYAADTGAGIVTAYDDKGNAKAQITVDDADHLFYDGTRYLYIAGEKAGIFIYDTTAGSAAKSGTSAQLFLDAQQANPSLDDIAGFAFGGDGFIYVASRKGKAIQRYPVVLDVDPPTCNAAGGTPFVSSLPDEPEFIQLGP
ncbi:MAG TPA: hypothetical protein VFB22_12520 [Candidatus Baltobacteraceae bacterium]|nr:hypothetical protein [Candidatus Baltobacteraceae bacterium]